MHSKMNAEDSFDGRGMGGGDTTAFLCKSLIQNSNTKNAPHSVSNFYCGTSPNNRKEPATKKSSVSVICTVI